jgi:hypothetical protein
MPGFHACKAGALLFKLHLQSILLWLLLLLLLLEMSVSYELFAGMVSDHDSPYLSLPNS